MGDKDKGEGQDARVDYIRSRVQNTFAHMAANKFEKSWGNRDEDPL